MCLGHPVVERKMLVFLALVPHRLKSDGGFPSQISSRKEGFILYLNLLYLIFLLWPRRCCLGKTGLLKARSSSAALRCFLVRSSVRRKKKEARGFNTDFTEKLLWGWTQKCWVFWQHSKKHYSKEFHGRDHEYTRTRRRGNRPCAPMLWRCAWSLSFSFQCGDKSI